MDEPVFSWRGLRLDFGDGEAMAPSDLSLIEGRSVLVASRDPRLLKALSRLASARDPFEDAAAGELVSGEARWEGKTLFERKTPGDRLGLFRRIALVGSRARLLSGVSLVDSLILELEYNQAMMAKQARASAMETLERLGLAPAADVPGSDLDGPDWGLALMAMALSRRPALMVLDRPRALMDDAGFKLAWKAVAEDIKAPGRAALVFDYAPDRWAGELAVDDILSL
jgi:energy-coupling factor transporter ATP-binding protein EcfA2